MPEALTTEPDSQVAALIEAMRTGMVDAPEIYRPGEFWEDLIARNLEMLETEGIANLKRTVSNNYYNWMVTSLRDPQVRRAFANWCRHPSAEPFAARIGERLSGLRATNREAAFGLSPRDAWLYKTFVAMIWDVARREDRHGLTLRLSEPEVGNPLRIHYRGRLISQDLANSVIEHAFASRSGVLADGARVAELGAGYGRLAFVHAQAARVAYCIFDIPPALAVSQWYLTEVLGEGAVVPYARRDGFDEVAPLLRPGTVAFFTPDQIDLFPDRWFHLTQTISTLPEMPEQQSRHYLQVLAAKSDRAVFLKQWRRWRNPHDEVELSEADHVLPGPWRLAERRVDPIQPAFFNQLWARSA